jgi:hypothetical protein
VVSEGIFLCVGSVLLACREIVFGVDSDLLAVKMGLSVVVGISSLVFRVRGFAKLNVTSRETWAGCFLLGNTDIQCLTFAAKP